MCFLLFLVLIHFVLSSWVFWVHSSLVHNKRKKTKAETSLDQSPEVTGEWSATTVMKNGTSEDCVFFWRASFINKEQRVKELCPRKMLQAEQNNHRTERAPSRTEHSHTGHNCQQPKKKRKWTPKKQSNQHLACNK